MEVKGIKLKTSRIAYLSNYLLASLILILLLLALPFLKIFVNTSHYIIFFAALIFTAILLEEPEIRRFFRTYFITNNEVMKIEGIIRKNKLSIPYRNMTSVSFYKGVIGRIFNFGDISISAGQKELKLHGIRNPEEFVRIIENKVSLMKKETAKKGKE
jgi:uncharacterized membrane protein YdbT with pleckstrin-like domain